jgi:hypothetical protein
MAGHGLEEWGRRGGSGRREAQETLAERTCPSMSTALLSPGFTEAMTNAAEEEPYSRR